MSADITAGTPPDPTWEAILQSVNWEARMDKQGNLVPYELPAGDGGGSVEIAGINDRYHPDMVQKLLKMQPAQREKAATDYYHGYTAPVRKWSTHPAIQSFLQDTYINRGPGGTAWVIQRATGINEDGLPGPQTSKALQEAEKANPAMLLNSLRRGREAYEVEKVGTQGNRAKFQKGLQNRWNKAYNYARTLL